MSVDTSGDLGSLLGIWAHPDDEAYLSAGLMIRATEAGHRVVCVTATKGEAGFSADDERSAPERMGEFWRASQHVPECEAYFMAEGCYVAVLN
jgi:LmbE family N-acetylglucosaminyl deacetylase